MRLPAFFISPGRGRTTYRKPYRSARSRTSSRAESSSAYTVIVPCQVSALTCRKVLSSTASGSPQLGRNTSTVSPAGSRAASAR